MIRTLLYFLRLHFSPLYVNTQAMTTDFIKNVMNGMHAFAATEIRAATTKDTLMGALYFATATIDSQTAVYTAVGEVGNSGSYTAGGIAFTTATAPNTSGTAANGVGNKAFFTPSASWTTGASFSAAAFDCLLMYNGAFATKRSIAAFTFGSQTIVAGTFTLTMPTNDGTTGLIRFGT